nr:MazG nucleotide pyrophosphohydrolase domain-containing protein [Brevibacterium daeguense]
MAYIRARCPWAAAHTHTSLQKYLLEETYELLAALDAHDRAPGSKTRQEVVGELGDVLYQVLFHAALLDSAAGAADVGDGVGAAAAATAGGAVETGGAVGAAAEEGTGEESTGEPRLRADPCPAEAFTAVVERLKAKLVRRHPHVFDSDGPVDIEEVERRYEAVKVAERQAAVPGAAGAPVAAGAADTAEATDAADPARSSATARAAQARASFESVPASMPALTRAQSVLGRIERLELPVPAAVAGEHEDAGEERESAEAIGEELFSLVTRAHRLGVDAESALRQATARAEDRVIRQARFARCDEQGDS